MALQAQIDAFRSERSAPSWRQAKINLTTGHESFEAWREAEHDDMVLALALPCWIAEHIHVESFKPFLA